MKQLIIFGKEHPIDTEIEILDDSEFGMRAEIHYDIKECMKYMIENGVSEADIDLYCDRINKIEIRNNITEFHHLYNRNDDYNILKEEDNSAFESNIHGTGGTKKVKYIDKIIITKAEKLYDEYYGQI
jgi:hypothetical protein